MSPSFGFQWQQQHQQQDFNILWKLYYHHHHQQPKQHNQHNTPINCYGRLVIFCGVSISVIIIMT